MAYKVIEDFKDKETKHIYRAGDKYPEKGRIKKARETELAGSDNAFGKPVIVEEEPEEA